MNAIRIIQPYRYAGQWVFNDAAVGLEREPFVAGIDTMIDQMVADIPDADTGFRLIFSDSPFPGYNICVEWRREEMGGHWYFSPDLGIEGWLCPALFKYFDAAPPKIYALLGPSKPG